MKNKFLLGAVALACTISTLFVACKDEQDLDSVAKLTSVPQIFSVIDENYFYGKAKVNIQTDLPDIVGIAVDSIYGFDGGFGGKTGSDTLYLKKSDILGAWPEVTSTDNTSITFSKLNKGNYRGKMSTNIVIVDVTVSDPGPTDLSGIWKRTSNGYLLKVYKAAPGLFVILNPGGAPSVPSNPYLLLNRAGPGGTDVLEFPIQKDLCGGGLMLVAPTAVPGSPSSDYFATAPPQLVPGSPLALKWKVMEFAEALPSSIGETGICNWGGAVRTFEKQ